MPDSSKKREPGAPIVSAVLDAWAAAGKREMIRVSGASMRPMLGDGSRVLVQFGAQDFRIGDIIVFRQCDALTIHRIVRITYRHGDEMYETKGDSSFNLDPSLVNERDVIGKVVGIVRSGRTVDIQSGWPKRVGRALAFLSFLFGSAVRACKRVCGPRGGSRGNDTSGGR
jgi:signal peptidase I